MKRNKKIVTVVLALLLAFILAGCSAAGMGGKGGMMSGDWGSGAGDKADADVPSESGDSDGEYDWEQTPIARELTAAAWSDGEHYEFWRSLFSAGDEQTQAEIFASFADKDRGLNTAHMHTVTVTDGTRPIVGASVRLYKGEELLYASVTDSCGKAYVFGAEATEIAAESGEYAATVPFAENATVTLGGGALQSAGIELMFVVDTTGSMGDELAYLQKELAGVVRRIADACDTTVRLGLLFYRDEGDAYVTRSFDFVTVSEKAGLDAAIKSLAAQSYGGGGDYPEAVEVALSEAVGAQWSTGATTKLLFHILDAPYHDGDRYAQPFASAVESAAKQGIRIVPLAASGLDTLGQYIMRSAALLTGGIYTFLTDDSGIGNSHEEPVVGEYTVEYLSDLLVRLTVGYYTGTFPDPVDYKTVQ